MMKKVIALSLLCAVFMGVSAYGQSHNKKDTLFIRGWVWDSVNHPIESAAVEAIETGCKSQTDSLGRFSIGPLPEDNYIVVIRKDGYISIVDTSLVLSKSTAFRQHYYTMQKGADTLPAANLVPKHGCLKGIVKSGKGGMSDVLVSIEGSTIKSFTTMGGFWKISRVPIGIYKIGFSSWGYSKKIKKNVVVQNDSITAVNVSLECENHVPMIFPDQTGTVRSITRDEIERMPGH